MRYVALLRAVNVAGHGALTMADLRAILTRAGLSEVQTVLQSGNALFTAESATPAKLETLIEGVLAKRTKAAVDVMVRSALELKKIVGRNPFPAEAERDPARLVLIALKAAPDAAQLNALQAAIVGRETMRADGRQLYVFYPDGQGRSKLTNALIEKKLGTRGTARNWNTVLRLAALL